MSKPINNFYTQNAPITNQPTKEGTEEDQDPPVPERNNCEKFCCGFMDFLGEICSSLVECCEVFCELCSQSGPVDRASCCDDDYMTGALARVGNDEGWGYEDGGDTGGGDYGGGDSGGGADYSWGNDNDD